VLSKLLYLAGGSYIVLSIFFNDG